MTALHDTGRAHSPRAWLAIPQPTTAELSSGVWSPSTVRVTADDPMLAREAERLTRELAALGIPDGESSVVCLRRDDRADESFEITVGEDIAVSAGTAAGAFRATRQLLHNLRAQGLVPHGRVCSAPVVAERGFHLDAARKHFPAPWIVDLLHALADVGVTTFQWHVSENEGFRIGSEAFPEIVSSAHVTRAEALVVADTAADLHIDLVPSLDMPGHLRHALAAHPDLRLPDAGGLPTDHALDITRAAAIDFAAALIDDVAALFPRSTRWHLGGDEFVDFARIEEYPALAAAAREQHGPRATGFDLLTAFVNALSAHLRARGLAPRVWNDGMLRSETVALDPDLVLTWWTNWHVEMRPLAAAVDAGNPLVNFHDALLYYVLGEKAGYTYPTSARIWESEWHPGLFPALPDGTRQEIPMPYPARLLGASFSVWSDDASAQTPEEVADGVRRPLRAMAERAWNGISALSHDQFCEIDAAIGVATAPWPCAR
ncbi:family 20 glycosylhydrolase [Microbacterium maritypicum]|uniref:family 20 glycosylhydrolase n=1 Tax=Microbacterium maritypicum TaxID=33918 RepID=UPI001B33E75D|nr:family 20 glycosylhydrolase [Microbacterium liquefaciens]MBP5801638.1 family 20 glycosylhydrolase [Microbacterium liquefaciens]